MSKHEGFSGPFFPIFGPEKTLYLDTFHAVTATIIKHEKIVLLREAGLLFESGGGSKTFFQCGGVCRNGLKPKKTN